MIVLTNAFHRSMKTLLVNRQLSIWKSSFRNSIFSISQSKNATLRKYFPLFSGITVAICVGYSSISVYGSEKSDYSETLSDGAKKPEKWTLYQYATCPFCSKVRTFLEFYGIGYDIVEVNPLFRKEIKFSEYRKVPILKSETHQLNDSSLIISVMKTHILGKVDIDKVLMYYPVLESKNEKGKKVVEYQNRHNIMYGQDFSDERNAALREEAKWRRWVDDTFVHTLSPNIYRTMAESFQAMEYITHVGNFTSFERSLVYYSGALAMYVIGKRLKKRHHLKAEVRESLYEEAREWTRAVGKNRKYLGGNQPNLADLNMYGVINAIEGLGAFNDLMKNTNIEPWYQRMKKKVTSHAGAKESDWLEGI